MRDKYYVRCGSARMVLMASNSIHACMEFFTKTFGREENGRDSIGNCFSVSNRGFEKHDDDELYSTAEIIRLVQLSNNYEGQKN